MVILGWFVVLALMVLAIPGMLVWVAVVVLRLRRQVRELGTRLDGLSSERASARARTSSTEAEDGVSDVASSSSLAALLGVDEGNARTGRTPGDALAEPYFPPGFCQRTFARARLEGRPRCRHGAVARRPSSTLRIRWPRLDRTAFRLASG